MASSKSRAMFPMTPWVRRLIIANAAVFLLSYPPGASLLPTLYQEFALVPGMLLARPWTGITYMFLHGGVGHIFFNMIALLFFGPRLEQRLGGRDFLLLYFLSGFGGAAFSFLFEPTSAVIGASGAVYGVLLGFAMIWPHERIYIWGVLPMPAWGLAALLVGISLWAARSGAMGGTAHFAHLGGLVTGFVFLKWADWRRGAARRDFQRRLDGGAAAASPGGGIPGVGMISGTGDRSALTRWEAMDLSGMHELNREEVVSLLGKAKQFGVASLTPRERQFLDRMAASGG